MTRTSDPPLPPPGGIELRDPNEAFVAFYEHELPHQLRRAVLLVGDREAAADLVHDAFVAVYRRWDQLGEPGPYLSRAVLNGCRDHGRRLSTRVRRLPLLIERGAPEDEVLWDALHRLPFNQRAAIVLRFYHQLTERETADLLGCRTGSVGPWIHRGLRKLRKELS